jgi:hypothetical protein
MISEDELMQKIIDAVAASGTAALGNNYNRILPSLVSGSWNNDLRVQVENAHKGQIHSWMASRITHGSKRRTGRSDYYWGVRVRGLLYVWDNGDLDNSEKYIRSEIAQAIDYFAEHKDLGLDQQTTGFLGHDELIETNRTIQYANNGACHVTNLYLGCRLFKLHTNL